MATPLTCEMARELAPDLALGGLAGEERADLLDHLSSCSSCEALSRELADVVDTLLLLTPEADPPPGFESAVLSRVASLEAHPSGPPRRWVRRLLTVAAAVVLVAGTTMVVRQTKGGGTTSHLGGQYVAALKALGGKELRAAPLVGPSGRAWGQAFVYEGTSSWVFVTMQWDVPNGAYEVVLDRRGGQPSMSLSGLRLSAGMGSFGHSVGDTTDVTRVRVVDAAGQTVCSATLPTDKS